MEIKKPLPELKNKKELCSRISFNTASPPPEVEAILEAYPLPKNAIEGWLAVPTLNLPDKRLAKKDIEKHGGVDAFALIESLLGNRVLDQTLRTIDVLNGCGHHCDTCLADSALPSRMFSYKSLDKLFHDGRFLDMLQPDSVRFGSSGDILDHPQAVEIIKMSLEATESLHIQRMMSEGKPYKVKVFTNYRPNLEKKLDELIELSKAYPDRFKLIISLPLNREDTINSKFAEYVVSRPEIFGFENYYFGEDRLLRIKKEKLLPSNIGVQDVRHSRVLQISGRLLSDGVMETKYQDGNKNSAEREYVFEERGAVKTFLNPDALWLHVYGTQYESHTARVFTPINEANLNTLSQLPYHSDFATPPNWPGSSYSRIHKLLARERREEALDSDNEVKPLTIVDDKGMVVENQVINPIDKQINECLPELKISSSRDAYWVKELLYNLIVVSNMTDLSKGRGLKLAVGTAKWVIEHTIERREKGDVSSVLDKALDLLVQRAKEVKITSLERAKNMAALQIEMKAEVNRNILKRKIAKKLEGG